MALSVRELIFTIKFNQPASKPITRVPPQERGQQQKQGQDALVREVVDQTLRILEAKKER